MIRFCKEIIENYHNISEIIERGFNFNQANIDADRRHYNELVNKQEIVIVL